MIKQDLIETFKIIKQVNRLTYEQLGQITGLKSSQLSNILKHDGHLVSVESIEKAINKLGFGVCELEYYNIEEDQE
jgi:transcriptional regulator with XRE-family HTH domain